MTEQTGVLLLASVLLALVGLTTCPAPRPFMATAPDSAFRVIGWRDSAAECRIVTHPDYGMFATCWPRRWMLESAH